MSSWVDNQRQEAFLLYRRYIGMQLHFREGSSYDYSIFGGNTNVTPQAFLRKPKQEVMMFIQLKNKLKGENFEHFLLANARLGKFYVQELLTKQAWDAYEDWKVKFGTKENYLETCKGLFQTQPKMFSVIPLIKQFLDDSTLNSDYLELVAWLLNREYSNLSEVYEAVKDDVFLLMSYHKAVRLKKLYSYFCLI